VDRYIFVSYARGDATPVRRFLDALDAELDSQKLGVHMWRDEDRLQPGQSWQATIEEALANSVALLIFVSAASMRSEWVQRELQAVLRRGGRLVVPVILEHVADLPESIANLQWLDISADLDDPDRLRRHAVRLVSAIADKLPTASGRSPLSRDEARELAEITAQEVRKSTLRERDSEAPPPNSLFVVHGHDLTARDQVCEFVRSLSIEPIVLSQTLGQSQSLLQKFFAVSQRARFAVVLLTADDFGASLLQYNEPDVADRALQFRARQNVILELGFFYGQLGWENVFVLLKRAPRVFPNFERPSDLDGVVFDEVDDSGRWKTTLASKLAEAGFALTANT
jgi:predicted nucleotide-binding protein